MSFPDFCPITPVPQQNSNYRKQMIQCFQKYFANGCARSLLILSSNLCSEGYDQKKFLV